MSELESLANAVRQMAQEADQIVGSVYQSRRRVEDLTMRTMVMARGSDAPNLDAVVASMRAASTALAECASSVSLMSVEASTYAGYLASGGGGSSSEPPLAAVSIAVRTTGNRINLADDVDAVLDVPEYGGYLDLVMHADAEGTQADIGRSRIDFTIDQVETMVRRSPSWQERPVRLMACSAGEAHYAQNLADRLGVAVYAPSSDLGVGDGRTVVIDGGEWRRFEPRAG